MSGNLHIGRAVIFLREERDMTQAQLVAHTGLDRKIIHRVEHGIGDLHLGTLDKVAHAFGLQTFELLRLAERLRETMDTRGEDSPALTAALWRAA